MKSLDRYILEKFQITKDSKVHNYYVLNNLNDLTQIYSVQLTHEASTSVTKRYQLFKADTICNTPIIQKLLYDKNEKLKEKLENDINKWFNENFKYDKFLEIIVRLGSDTSYKKLMFKLRYEFPNRKNVYITILNISIDDSNNIYIDHDSEMILAKELKKLQFQSIAASMINYIANYDEEY